jgi:RNA polymerase sigma-70 factor (ECF subfamily)
MPTQTLRTNKLRLLTRSRGAPSESSIATAMRRGDPGAIDALYAEYGGTVFSYLMRALGDRTAAEDVHQQVFAEIWERTDSYDPERAGLLTWILTVARSRAVDHMRRDSRRPEPRDPAGVAALADARAAKVSPGELMIERWRISHLLQRIPREEAELLRMRFYEDHSQREIAEITGTPLGTVKMRMVQALERLRSLMDEEEER